METILALLAFLILSVTPRAHGSGWFPYGRAVATAIIGLLFGIAAVMYWGSAWALLGGVLSAGAFTLGHGNFYAMRGAATPDKPELIERFLVRPLWNLRGGDIHTPAYSWWCMGVKWALVGACLFPFGLLLAIAAPAAYAASFYKTSDSESAEWLNGIVSGFVLAAIMASNII